MVLEVLKSRDILHGSQSVQLAQWLAVHLGKQLCGIRNYME